MKEKSSGYFNSDVENFIICFKKASNIEEKNKIFVNNIKFSFEKLIENLINIYKFYKYTDCVSELKNDCLSFLYENIEKFNEDSGSKAFSYFNVVARNWLIQRNKEYRNKIKKHINIDFIYLKDVNSSLFYLDELFEDSVVNDEFVFLLEEQLSKWKNKFQKEKDRKTVEAILYIIKNLDKLSLRNKKSFFIYIRDLTSFENKQIILSLKKIKFLYKSYKKKYNEGDI